MYRRTSILICTLIISYRNGKIYTFASCWPAYTQKNVRKQKRTSNGLVDNKQYLIIHLSFNYSPALDNEGTFSPWQSWTENWINRKRTSEAMIRKTSKPRKPFVSSPFRRLCTVEGFFCCITDGVFIDPAYDAKKLSISAF